jgi:hypothetical protein
MTLVNSIHLDQDRNHGNEPPGFIKCEEFFD